MTWTRFGPRRIVDSAWVIVALSRAWRERWEGRNEPTVGAGAVAEADALPQLIPEGPAGVSGERSCSSHCRPEAGEDVVPTGLDGVHLFSLSDYSSEQVMPLIRLITGQPEYPAGPLGSLPELPPVAAPLSIAAMEMRDNIEALRRRIANSIPRGVYWRDLLARGVFERHRQTLMQQRPLVYEPVSFAYLWFHELNESVPLGEPIPPEQVEPLKQGIGQVEHASGALRELIIELSEDTRAAVPAQEYVSLSTGTRFATC